MLVSTEHITKCTTKNEHVYIKKALLLFSVKVGMTGARTHLPNCEHVYTTTIVRGYFFTHEGHMKLNKKIDSIHDLLGTYNRFGEIHMYI